MEMSFSMLADVTIGLALKNYPKETLKLPKSIHCSKDVADIFNHHITLVQCNVIVNIIYLITNYNQFYSNLHPSRLTYFCGVSQRDLSRADIYKTRKSKLSLFKHLFVAETTPSEYIDLLDRRLSQSSSALFSVTFVDNGASSS